MLFHPFVCKFANYHIATDNMKRILPIILTLLATAINAQETVYEKDDSLFIMSVVEKYKNEKQGEQGELLLKIAGEFLEHPYVGGTLENGKEEPLTIKAFELDCTTFVELVTAIGTTIKRGEEHFEDVCKNLQTIRYRNGERNGYSSRLHYMTQWIADEAKQGIVYEIPPCRYSRQQVLNLNFMSSNPGNYPLLKNDALLVEEIKEFEEEFRGFTVDYIPKEQLNRPPKELPVENGDIIILTTNIKGLDAVHVGFAFWENNRLHLLHASSAAGMVVKEKNPLFMYQRNKKSQTGIRIFRAE